MAGGFFGGLAEGFSDVRQQQIQQQQIDQQGQYQQGQLKLEQQRVQNEQQRALFARADKDVSNLMDTASHTIETLKLQGKDNVSIAKAIQPLVQAAKRLKQGSGGDPSTIDAQVAATLAQPNPAEAVTGQPQSNQPRGIRNNNPGNIEAGQFAQSQPGYSGSDGRFAKFDTPQQGMDATSNLLSTYGKQGINTVSGIINKWAPSTDGNNTQTYAGFVAKKLGVSPDTPLNMNDPVVRNSVASAIGEFENGRPVMSETDRWTRALATLPSNAPPGVQAAIKTRLQAAIQQETPDATVHFAKTDTGDEIPLVVTKQGGKVSITDTNGNPYVTPTGGGGAGEIADAIMSGKQPPVTTGLYKQGAAVRAQLAKKGFDVTSAELEWKAAQKQVQSLNGPQMTRYAGLAKSVVNTIDEVKSLSEQMANSGIPMLNAAKIQTYIQTAGNSEKGQLASRYLGAVNTLKEEFANLAQGGYAPTEAAWALANQQINGNYGVQQLSASLNEVQRLIRYRLQGIPNFQSLGPDAANRYTKGAGEAQPQSEGGNKSSSSSIPPPPAGFVMTGR